MSGCRPLTDPEITLVSQSFGGTYAARDTALFVVGVRTGFRIAELLSLRVGDISCHGSSVEYLTVARRHMKGKLTSRIVALHQEAREALQTWLTDLKTFGLLTPERFVFCSRKGANKAISERHARRLLVEAFQGNALSGKLSTHTLRKTFARRVHTKLGHDMCKTQHALGHKNISTTVQYLQVTMAEIYQAMLA